MCLNRPLRRCQKAHRYAVTSVAAGCLYARGQLSNVRSVCKATAGRAYRGLLVAGVYGDLLQHAGVYWSSGVDLQELIGELAVCFYDVAPFWRQAHDCARQDQGWYSQSTLVCLNTSQGGPERSGHAIQCLWDSLTPSEPKTPSFLCKTLARLSPARPRMGNRRPSGSMTVSCILCTHSVSSERGYHRLRGLPCPSASSTHILSNTVGLAVCTPRRLCATLRKLSKLRPDRAMAEALRPRGNVPL